MATKTTKLPPIYFAERGINGSMHHTYCEFLSAEEASESRDRIAGYWKDHPAAMPCVLSGASIRPYTDAERKLLTKLRTEDAVVIGLRKNSLQPEQVMKLERLGVIRVKHVSELIRDHPWHPVFKDYYVVRLTNLGCDWLRGKPPVEDAR
jgi:hypothetical protein